MWPLASLVVTSAKRTLYRFPAPILSAIVSAALLIELKHREFQGERPFTLVLAATLGIPLGTALTLLAERPPKLLARVPARKLLACVITIIFCAVYGSVLRSSTDTGDGYVLTYAQFSLAAHLAVAFAPFLGAGTTRGVWQFNRHLFLRFPLSMVYTGVILAGLLLALGAATQLFGLKVNDDRVFEVWMVTTFVVQTWHFLAGVPENFAELDEDGSYPKGLRIFAQFVLLPLLGLYFAILYAYVIKIVLAQELPNGWVGWMVSAASGFGMLSLLLLFPAREGKSGGFVRAVETTFHVSILPLLALLFVSLGERTRTYGITERRYFLAVLGAWLLAASIYRLRGGRNSLTWIPASLAVLGLATSFGPWGARAVSLRSQSGRLQELLMKSDRAAGAKEGAAPVSFKDEREISRILDYLVESHGSSTLQKWPTRTGVAQSQTQFMHARGLNYVDLYRNDPDVVSFYSDAREPIEVRGYDWLVPAVFATHGYRSEKSPSPFWVRLAESGTELEILEGEDPRAVLSLTPVIAQVERERPSGKSQGKQLTLSAESGHLGLRLHVEQLTIERHEERWTISSGQGTLLIRELTANR